MICCETKEKYKKLWDDFNQQISEEPLIFPKRFAKPLNQDGEQQLKMTCELDKVLIVLGSVVPRAETRVLVGKGRVYLYIHILPGEFLLKSFKI